jgi:hypothetical protein
MAIMRKMRKPRPQQKSLKENRTDSRSDAGSKPIAEEAAKDERTAGTEQA